MKTGENHESKARGRGIGNNQSIFFQSGKRQEDYLSMQSSISKYRITKRVGGGSFGDIYLGVGANGEKVRRVGWRFFPGRSIGHGERRGKIERVSPVHRFPVNSIVRKLSWGTPKKITCNYDMNLRGASAADTEGIAKSYGRICRTKFSLMDPTGGVPGSCGVGGRTSWVILLANETRSLRPPSLFLGVPSAEGCVGWTMTALGGDLCLVMNHVLCCGSFILKRGWALQGGKIAVEKLCTFCGIFSRRSILIASVL